MVRNLRAATEGAPLNDLAAAADTDPETLQKRLDGRDEPTVADLVGVGGFLRINPTEFLKGATT